ncbi:DNA (cytosine-5-)-methyltransferase 3 beta, duplicate a [Genypterus blacodes]|uniref:DNA (cytosine-5-)-methyltransferase 3 beta, duplicate a n=1 Tax=Genypterus blacodes TaxID=154954 RepID=UPI003F767E6A
MATEAPTSPDRSHDKSNRFHLVTWLNNLLKTSFQDVQQMGSGACHCQLMDWIIPGSVELTKVKFNALNEEDYRHNFNLLREAFSKNDITKPFPVDKLIKGDFKSNFEFLKWFKYFFTTNVKNEDYDPVKARDSQEISPNLSSPTFTSSSPRTKSWKLESSVNENGAPTPKTFPFDDEWKLTFDWIDRSLLGELYSWCHICEINIQTFAKGPIELKRHMESNKHKKMAKKANSRKTEPLPCSDAMIRFIQEYSGSAGNGNQVSSHFARHVVASKYSKDILSVCQSSPYCVYIYGGVNLGEEETVSVILVGFFDVSASRHCIRLLDAVQSEADDAGDQGAAAIMETLKKFGLPTANLAAVYLDGNVAASEQICSQLREHNPNILALGGLFKVADAACHAGIMELSNQAQQMIGDIHALHCATENDILKDLFGNDNTADSPFKLDTSCLNFCALATKILGMWTDLMSYFGSCEKDDDKAKIIFTQLQDTKLRATFLFLVETMKPLHTFQKHLQTHEGAARADLVLILEEASSLLRSYASYFLHPQAVGRFLKECDNKILKNEKFHLSGSERSLGGSAVEDFLNESKAPEVLPLLQEEVLPFYVAVTENIAEHVPLSEGFLRSMAQLLNPQNRLNVTGKAVGELGTKLGICSSPEEVNQLTSEFLEYQLVKEGENEEGPTENSPEVSLEEHWAGVLKEIKPASAFRKLILTLLSLPCPPLEAQRVFTVVMENRDTSLSSESEATIESEQSEAAESDFTTDGVLSDKESPAKREKRVKGPRCHSMTLKPCAVRLKKIAAPNDDIGTVFTGNGSMWQEAKETLSSHETSPSPRKARRKLAYQDGKGFLTNELVWGKLKGFSMWPGMVMPWKTKLAPTGLRRVEWFGDGMFSEIYTEGLLPFRSFTTCFCKNSYASLPTYKEAIYQVIELAGERCGKSFAATSGTKVEKCKRMLDWASGGFLPTGPDGFSPPGSITYQDSSESTMSDSQPPAKRKYMTKYKANVAVITYNRAMMVENVKKKGKTVEDFCLPCGSPEIEAQHPLFEGALCLKCKENFTETLYRYDEDGYQSYCTVCCAGLEVILCGNPSCCRCFCKDCLDTLVGPDTFEKQKEIDPWSCYICKPSDCAGNLKLRSDWSIKVQEFFANNSAMQFEPHRVYPSIPAHQRRPIRVLSLFDGIATGFLVLKDLGFKVEHYIASEICEDSITVGMVKHTGKVEYVNDVRAITRKHLAEWGPFDLLIGGSPCNDLSMVNPARKGLFEGTGRLFFEFYRILTMLKPREDDDRPFFWLFENVVFMSSNDKSDICRFLECNPVLIDAVKVSPAHRARYFWGNLPGMNRPLATSLDDKVTLQDCLEIGRKAMFDKVRTITTKSNSIRQGKLGPLPVCMNGKEDSLWCTEMEQIFGFPKHYTDVNNMGKGQRQRVLGRSWSVPVIRHLFAPLRDYFECKSGM